jgi:hypothetical protein
MVSSSVSPPAQSAEDFYAEAQALLALGHARAAACVTRLAVAERLHEVAVARGRVPTIKPKRWRLASTWFYICRLRGQSPIKPSWRRWRHVLNVLHAAIHNDRGGGPAAVGRAVEEAAGLLAQAAAWLRAREVSP